MIISGEPRMAVSFEPPSLVRVGLIVEDVKVVDSKSVQQAGYFLFLWLEAYSSAAWWQRCRGMR